MTAVFPELIQSFIERRNLPVEQVATLANLSRKTVYRWVNGEVSNPRHWYQIVASGKALCLSIEEVNELLRVTRNPSFVLVILEADVPLPDSTAGALTPQRLGRPA